MPRRLLLTISLTVVLLGVLPGPARAPVTGVSVRTDRTDYVLGMSVTVTASIAYTGGFTGIDEDARVEWRNATWALVRAEYVPKTRLTNSEAQAVASWAPPATGVWHVNVSANETNGTPPVHAGAATIRIWSATDYVIASGIAVATDRGLYEQFEIVTATASITSYVGNVSHLERVEFNWTDPAGATLRIQTVAVTNASAVDTWAPPSVGANFVVNATYIGNDSVWDTAVFTVIPVSNPATNVSAGATVTWDAARSPWRVCGDVFVNLTGTLVIEPNTTVKFCRGSRLVVRGSLTGDGSAAAPITFTSREFPPADGDWNGVWFEGSADSRLVGAVVEYAVDGIRAEGGGPTLVGLVARNGTGEAVHFANASGTLQDASITGFGLGVRLANATTLVQNLTVSAIAREGVVVEGDASGLVLRDVRVTGGTRSLRAVSASGLRVERAALTEAALFALDLVASTATIANASIAGAAGGIDFLLVASTATLVNCTFLDDAARRTLVTPSRIFVQNFLAVSVATAAGAPLPGAAVNVTVNGVPRAQRTTDAAGLAAWILVEDRVLNATATTKNTVLVDVALAGHTVAGSPRTVDMAVSHLEAFVATPIVGDGFVLEAAHFALVGLAVLVLSALLFLLRRRARREEPAPPPVPGAPAPLPDAEPGRSYAVLREKPHAAFERLAADVRGGAPGLVITRIRPEDARQRYSLGDVPIYWLSRSFGKDTLNPTNLGGIVELVRKHATGKPGCRVVLDGIEYLFTQNDFGKVVKFVQVLADEVGERKAVLLLPLDPQTLDPDRLAVLTRDLTSWS